MEAFQLLKDTMGFRTHCVCHQTSQVVHGIPNDEPLRRRNILSVDCGVLMNGYYGDSAYTYELVMLDAETKTFKSDQRSLYKGIEQAVAGNRIGDISNAVQQHAEAHNYGVVRELVGHGIG